MNDQQMEGLSTSILGLEAKAVDNAAAAFAQVVTCLIVMAGKAAKAIWDYRHQDPHGEMTMGQMYGKAGSGNLIPLDVSKETKDRIADRLKDTGVDFAPVERDDGKWEIVINAQDADLIRNIIPELEEAIGQKIDDTELRKDPLAQGQAQDAPVPDPEEVASLDEAFNHLEGKKQERDFIIASPDDPTRTIAVSTRNATYTDKDGKPVTYARSAYTFQENGKTVTITDTRRDGDGRNPKWAAQKARMSAALGGKGDRYLQFESAEHHAAWMAKQNPNPTQEQPARERQGQDAPGQAAPAQGTPAQQPREQAARDTQPQTRQAEPDGETKRQWSNFWPADVPAQPAGNAPAPPRDPGARTAQAPMQPGSAAAPSAGTPAPNVARPQQQTTTQTATPARPRGGFVPTSDDGIAAYRARQAAPAQTNPPMTAEEIGAAAQRAPGRHRDADASGGDIIDPAMAGQAQGRGEGTPGGRAGRAEGGAAPARPGSLDDAMSRANQKTDALARQAQNAPAATHKLDRSTVGR